MEHKQGKWAGQILDARNPDGLWGNFHTLSRPVSGKAITTEQAIRRLRVLGFTKEDEPIRTVLERMCLCVSGREKIDGYSEKTHDWPLFEKLMLSAWIRLFDPNNEIALEVARQWAFLAEQAFQSGKYRREDDEAAFRSLFGRNPKSAFERGFGMFYHAALLQGVVKPETERLLLDYYLEKPDGIFYIYSGPLKEVPENFASRKTVDYLAAIELLAHYRQAKEKLRFVTRWLLSNRKESGQWDLGPGAKDGIYFPLSDSWRKPELRMADCTERIQGILQKIES